LPARTMSIEVVNVGAVHQTLGSIAALSLSAASAAASSPVNSQAATTTRPLALSAAEAAEAEELLFNIAFFATDEQRRANISGLIRAAAQERRRADSVQQTSVKLKPAPEKFVAQLDAIAVSEANKDIDCPICQLSFGDAACKCDGTEDASIVRLPACNHLFHRHCIEPWLDSHNTCPTCRCTVTKTPKLGKKKPAPDMPERPISPPSTASSQPLPPSSSRLTPSERRSASARSPRMLGIGGITMRHLTGTAGRRRHQIDDEISRRRSASTSERDEDTDDDDDDAEGASHNLHQYRHRRRRRSAAATNSQSDDQSSPESFRPSAPSLAPLEPRRVRLDSTTSTASTQSTSSNEGGSPPPNRSQRQNGTARQSELPHISTSPATNQLPAHIVSPYDVAERMLDDTLAAAVRNVASRQMVYL